MRMLVFIVAVSVLCVANGFQFMNNNVLKRQSFSSLSMKTENNFNNNIKKVISTVALTFMFSNINIDNNNQLSFTPVNANARGKDIGSDDAGCIYVFTFLCSHIPCIYTWIYI
jgi:hypothetical protein